jgi:hypothetical protein
MRIDLDGLAAHLQFMETIKDKPTLESHTR